MRTVLALGALLALVPAAAACEGLSPGDRIESEGSLCTLAFILANRDGLYFATAGHCVQEGAKVTNPDHGDVGVGVLRHLVPDTGQPTDGEPGEDFGLVRIHPALYDKLQPKVCGWDGPTGIYEETPGGGGVRHYGHGLVFGDLGPAGQKREGVNLVNDDNYAFYWTGAGVPGDSGSAVLHEGGRALGVLTHVQVSPSTNGGTHLLRGFQLAEENGFAPMRLVLMGESPAEVLAQMQGAMPATPTPPSSAPTSPAKPTPPSNGTAPPGNATRPTPTPATASPTGEGISPAGEEGGAPAATQDDRETPAPGLALVALVAIGVALRRRR